MRKLLLMLVAATSMGTMSISAMDMNLLLLGAVQRRNAIGTQEAIDNQTQAIQDATGRQTQAIQDATDRQTQAIRDQIQQDTAREKYFQRENDKHNLEMEYFRLKITGIDKEEWVLNQLYLAQEEKRKTLEEERRNQQRLLEQERQRQDDVYRHYQELRDNQARRWTPEMQARLEKDAERLEKELAAERCYKACNIF